MGDCRFVVVVGAVYFVPLVVEVAPVDVVAAYRTVCGLLIVVRLLFIALGVSERLVHCSVDAR